MSPVILPATVEDIPELIPLINTSFNNFNGQGAGWTDAASYVNGPRINPEDPYELVLANHDDKKMEMILKYCEDDENQKILACVKLEIEEEEAMEGNFMGVEDDNNNVGGIDNKKYNNNVNKLEIEIYRNGNYGHGDKSGQPQVVCHLKLLAVLPDLQGKGIGSRLLDASEDWIKSQGCSVIEIDVGSTMKSLIEYYERRGYLRTGKTEPYVIRPGCAVPTCDIHMIFLKKLLQ